MAEKKLKRDSCGHSIKQVNKCNGGIMVWCELTNQIVTWGDCPNCPLEKKEQKKDDN